MDDTKTFEVKPEHIKLIKRMNVSWEDCEFGLPTLRCAGPYANPNAYRNMMEILGWNKSEKIIINGDEHVFNMGDHEVSETITVALDQLYKETQTVLQIGLSTLKFEVGTYESDGYTTNWKKIK